MLHRTFDYFKVACGAPLVSYLALFVTSHFTSQHGTLKVDAILPGGDVVWQWDCDSGPRRAVDWTVDGGLVELEGRAAHVVD